MGGARGRGLVVPRNRLGNIGERWGWMDRKRGGGGFPRQLGWGNLGGMSLRSIPPSLHGFPYPKVWVGEAWVGLG